MSDTATKWPIMRIGMPVPLTLVPHLLAAVETWHSKECDIPNCMVFLADGGRVIHSALDKDIQRYVGRPQTPKPV